MLLLFNDAPETLMRVDFCCDSMASAIMYFRVVRVETIYFPAYLFMKETEQINFCPYCGEEVERRHFSDPDVDEGDGEEGD